MDTQTTRAAQGTPPRFQKRSIAPAVPSMRDRALALLKGTIPLAVLSGSAYLVGYVFHATRLRTVGVNPELYSKSTVDYFVYAYQAWLRLVMEALPYLTEGFAAILAIVLFWVTITLLAVASLFVERLRWMGRVRAALADAAGIKRTAKIAFIPIFGSLVTFYIPFLFVVIYAIPVFIGEAAGRVEGRLYLKKAADLCAVAGTPTSRCTEISENGKLVGYGFVIDASDAYIALVEKGRGRSIGREGKEFSTRVP